MAKNTGKVFEDAIKKSVDKMEDTYYYRLRDPASSFNQTAESGLRFSITNDYDCLVYQFPNFFPLELKSSKQTSFSFQREKGQKSKMIKKSQIDGLTKASKVTGVLSGFLFNFSTKGSTYWLNIIDFNRFMEVTEKGSINEKDMIEYGAVLVEQRLKRVNYSYNMKDLIDKLKETYKN